MIKLKVLPNVADFFGRLLRILEDPMIDCTKMEGMGLLDIVGLHVVGSVMSLGTVDFENRNFDHHVHHSFGR